MKCVKIMNIILFGPGNNFFKVILFQLKKLRSNNLKWLKDLFNINHTTGSRPQNQTHALDHIWVQK